MTLPIKRIGYLALATALLLLVPLVAMQLTREVAWSPADFMVAGSLLFGTGLTYELARSRGGSRTYRAALGLALGTALLLVWLNLAVGLLDNESSPANLLYGGVLAVALGGALLARLRPLGMARALVATALAQALAPVLAVGLGLLRLTSGAACLEVVGVQALFVALWGGAAWLFRRAGASGAA